jgi:hypothetical protein
MERYKELRLLEKTGYIVDLQVYPQFDLIVNEKKTGTYTADFAYGKGPPEEINKRLTFVQEYVVEDVKSSFTRKNREYRRNRKLMEACHGVTIRGVVR